MIWLNLCYNSKLKTLIDSLQYASILILFYWTTVTVKFRTKKLKSILQLAPCLILSTETVTVSIIEYIDKLPYLRLELLSNLTRHAYSNYNISHFHVPEHLNRSDPSKTKYDYISLLPRPLNTSTSTVKWFPRKRPVTQPHQRYYIVDLQFAPYRPWVCVL